MRIFTLGCLALAACSGSDHSPVGGGGAAYGDVHSGGQYNLGPVEFSGSYPNACAPYPSAIEDRIGNLLAGVDNKYGASGDLCDACIEVKTAEGRSVIARIITYGVSNGSEDLDLSSAAYKVLSENEYPRTMSWQLTKCPDIGPILYQFQTGANPYWASLWVRDALVPVSKVEVKSANHADWFALERGPDGTLTDSGGFGNGSFTLRVTAVDGQQVNDTFAGFNPGDVLTSTGQFK
jgi:expansin (peptidoglycan-binding protein)